mmetsp:Transcript_5291/g.8816  ORF Transcript_5291/g.8816 Transcript_5291/m.8816 type:complete len:438 (-) Transcript_5291:339-1652(-)|eukprot:CAMPEP_0196132300 /NCGR_PEP_ID=MMETSP0910-20130528/1985_1 /TAXON_ID=49265 /ORGANISM="Thalassiosira rotula, Strain GSO102" /LENGTH=437 /DNA_ID=CAMNT_0041391899 /DNA_START=58 /DNA_END=1371 /DNA_ORIENTATION=+
MKSITPTSQVALTIASCFLLVVRVCSQTPFSFYSYIGERFLEENLPNEVSGLDIAPDGSHLVAVSDDGKLFFLNLDDSSSGHYVVDLSEDDFISGRSNFEGVAIDTGIWDPNNMHAYVVHEGNNVDEPYLFKIEYGRNEDSHFSAIVVDRKSLIGSIPCLEGSNGIESFGLMTASSVTDPAVFFVGIQDNGKIYEITSEGLSNGSDFCYDSGMGVDDVSSTTYDGTYFWSFIDREGMIAVVDPARDCTLAIYDTTLPANEEGLAIDFENGLVYVASDEGGDGIPSRVSAYNFTYPSDLDECMNEGTKTCRGFTVCGAAQSANNPSPYSASAAATSSFPAFFPTSYPTYFTINFSGYDVEDGGNDDDFGSSISSSSITSFSFSSNSYDADDADGDFGFNSFFFGADDYGGGDENGFSSSSSDTRYTPTSYPTSIYTPT